MEEKNLQKRKNKYKTGAQPFKPNTKLQESLNDIDERITAIENRYLKTDKKTSTTRAQQILILHHLGVLDKLNDFKISSKKKSKLLSVLLNASADNIEYDLSAIHKKESHLKTSFNYLPVTKMFKDAGIKDLEEETDKILDNLYKNEK